MSGVDEFGLDPDMDWEGVVPCGEREPVAAHRWGPWGFAEVDAIEVRFCTVCGFMEQQWLERKADR